MHITHQVVLFNSNHMSHMLFNVLFCFVFIKLVVDVFLKFNLIKKFYFVYLFFKEIVKSIRQKLIKNGVSYGTV